MADTWPWRGVVSAVWEDRGLSGQEEALLASWPVTLLPLAVIVAILLVLSPRYGIATAAMLTVLVVPYLWVRHRRTGLVRCELHLDSERFDLACSGGGSTERVAFDRSAVDSVFAAGSRAEAASVVVRGRAGHELLRRRGAVVALRFEEPPGGEPLGLAKAAPLDVVLMSWVPADAARLRPGLLPRTSRRWRGPALAEYGRWQRRRTRRFIAFNVVPGVVLLLALHALVGRDLLTGAARVSALAIPVVCDALCLYVAWWLRWTMARTRREVARLLAELPTRSAHQP